MQCLWRPEGGVRTSGGGIKTASHTTWVLGTKLRSSERAVSTLNCQAIFPALSSNFPNHHVTLVNTKPAYEQGIGVQAYRALGKLGQEDHKLDASLDHTARPCLKETNLRPHVLFWKQVSKQHLTEKI